MADDPNAALSPEDAFLVAEEVVSSAARILCLLRLNDDHIAELLLAAAREFKAGAEIDLSAHHHDDDDDDGVDAWHLSRLAEQEHFARDIARFAKRVEALRTDQEPGPEEIRKKADLCLKVIPAFAAAQRWYLERSAEHGRTLALSKDEWRASASDEMLDREHEVVFFDQLSRVWPEVRELVELAGDCETLAMMAPIVEILGAIEKEGLELPARTLKSLERAHAVASQYQAMLKMLERLAPGAEILRSELVNRLMSDLPVAVDSLLLEHWLGLAAAAGHIALTKKSNRWQVVKPATR